MGVTGLLLKAFGQGGFGKQTTRGTGAAVTGGAGRTVGGKPKQGKAGKLALIKTSRAGVFEKESGTTGRGKLFGN